MFFYPYIVQLAKVCYRGHFFYGSFVRNAEDVLFKPTILFVNAGEIESRVELEEALYYDAYSTTHFTLVGNVYYVKG